MQGARVQSLVRELDPTCMPQLRVHTPQLRSPPAATKRLHLTPWVRMATWCKGVKKPPLPLGRTTSVATFTLQSSSWEEAKARFHLQHIFAWLLLYYASFIPLQVPLENTPSINNFHKNLMLLETLPKTIGTRSRSTGDEEYKVGWGRIFLNSATLFLFLSLIPWEGILELAYIHLWDGS